VPRTAGTWRCPAAPTLTDSKDQPIRPYNFADASNDRASVRRDNQDLYRIFMTGLDGTPMPSFADVIQPNDAWDLVTTADLQIHRKSKESELLKAAAGRFHPDCRTVEC